MTIACSKSESLSCYVPKIFLSFSAFFSSICVVIFIFLARVLGRKTRLDSPLPENAPFHGSRVFSFLAPRLQDDEAGAAREIESRAFSKN